MSLLEGTSICKLYANAYNEDAKGVYLYNCQNMKPTYVFMYMKFKRHWGSGSKINYTSCTAQK